MASLSLENLVGAEYICQEMPWTGSQDRQYWCWKSRATEGFYPGAEPCQFCLRKNTHCSTKDEWDDGLNWDTEEFGWCHQSVQGSPYPWDFDQHRKCEESGRSDPLPSSLLCATWRQFLLSAFPKSLTCQVNAPTALCFHCLEALENKQKATLSNWTCTCCCCC